MKGPTKPNVTVILEDAYKQNTVYRPWKDITSGRKIEENAASGSAPVTPGADTPHPADMSRPGLH